jgi:hypothetical protein
MKSHKLATIFAVIGTLLALFVAFFKRGGTATGVSFPLIFVVGPWLVLDVLYIWLKWARSIAIAAGLMLALELLIYYAVFVNPQSSTDAVAYVFKPAVQLLFFLPIGLIIGRVIDKRVSAEAGTNKGMANGARLE